MWLIKKNVLLFIIGGIGYMLIELLFRGRTHITMFFAGGLSLLMFFIIEEKFKDLPLLLKATLASLSVTFIELVFGIIFNLIFDMKVWDYSDRMFNFLGQICPLFSLAWAALAMIVLPIVKRTDEYIEKMKPSNP